MKIDKKVIEDVAKNARLNLSEAEKERFIKEFNEILDAFSIVASAPVSDKASVHPEPILDVVREDVQTPCLTQDEALANTKHQKDGYFKGPKAV